MARKRDLLSEFNARYNLPVRIPARKPVNRSDWERRIVREFWR